MAAFLLQQHKFIFVVKEDISTLLICVCCSVSIVVIVASCFQRIGRQPEKTNLHGSMYQVGCLKKNLNVSRPPEHPPVSATLSQIQRIGCQSKKTTFTVVTPARGLLKR